MFMQQVETVLGKLADMLWGNWMMFALVGVGILYTIMTGFIQVRRAPNIFREMFSKNQKSTDTSISSMQALATAIASCVGSGNIVGVSTAIISGGPGALFWMWVAAFFGMATKYGEIVLGICYRGHDSDGMRMGGPMYYIAKGLKSPWLGSLVALLLFIQNAGGTLIQTNTIVNVVKTGFSIPAIVTGIIVSGMMSYIISGGLKRLADVATKIVPFMAGLYIIGGLIVIISNFSTLPAVFTSIFKNAFTLKAGVGGAVGISMKQAMRYGIARGLYSNEAGEGSAAVLHSTAEVDHPARQGMYGVVEVFVDTIIICTITGLVILSSGVSYLDASPTTLAATAFQSVYPPLQYIVHISLFLFCVTSLMSQWYFGNVSLNYLLGGKAATVYKIIFPITIIIASLLSHNLVWIIQDCALGFLIIPNLIALVVMSPEVRRLTKDFFDNPNEKTMANEIE